MNNTTKTTAAVAAAAAVAAGVALFTATEPAEQLATPGVDDVVPVTVEIPRVEIPQVAVPQVDVPGVELFRVVSPLELEALGIPAVEMPRAAAGSAAAPEVAAGSAATANVSPGSAATPEVASYTDRLPRLIELQKLQQELFRDQRNLMYDPACGLDSATWQRWIGIYRSEEYRNYKMQFVELKKGLRIICEVHCPESVEEFETLQQNLDYYRARQYNAVLVTFTTDEQLYRLRDTVDYLKSAGWGVVIAYAGGAENLRESLFKAPDRLAEFLQTLGAKADALLLGWRRTSVHLFLPDRQFTAFLVKNARAKNSSLAVIGVAYFGETAEQLTGVTYDVPENCSAVLVVGLGYPRASTRTALRTLFPEVANHPHLIGLAVGERPYFDSLHDTGKTQAENDAIKRRIELRLLRAGCASTLTYRGDGGNGSYGRPDRTENLCLPYGAAKGGQTKK